MKNELVPAGSRLVLLYLYIVMRVRLQNPQPFASIVILSESEESE